jgi:hypothetical protein
VELFNKSTIDNYQIEISGWPDHAGGADFVAKSKKRQSATRKSAKPRSARKTAPRKPTPGKPAARSLIVTLSSDRAIQDVARDLKAAGLHVEQVLDATGIVTGSADARNVAKLKRVKGVADVSADHPVDIGPPDADIS